MTVGVHVVVELRLYALIALPWSIYAVVYIVMVDRVLGIMIIAREEKLWKLESQAALGK